MPVAKICTSGTSNAMKSEDVNDPLDNFIKQTIGKEPLLPFSRSTESPVQWIQLLHALDQPDLPGWPLLTPLKVQMQKCEKCSREFCSPINYRRHIRVHRRSLNVKKESQKNRDLLAAFWDKLSLEEAKEVVSFDSVMLKEIPGSSVIRALSSSLRKPTVWTLPQVYVRAGSALLDVIQAKPSRLPISSQELFSILDDASERTFLCAGTADSVQKYVFDGETAKNSLELKNLVATTSFLFEQQLVKAWIADKDAEALRCQKLLVEEEEAAQRRQAALLERKKQKKLHQKEQKVRELFHASNEDLNVTVDAAGRSASMEVSGPNVTVDADQSASPEVSGPTSPSHSGLNSPNVPTNMDSSAEFVPPENRESDKDVEEHFSSTNEHFNQEYSQINECQMVGFNQEDSQTHEHQIVGFNSEDSQTYEHQTVVAKSHRHPMANRWQGPKLQRGGRHGFRPTQNLQASKPEALHKLNQTKGQNVAHGTKVWTKKVEADSDGYSSKPTSVQAENSLETDENNREVIIGSIPVTLKRAAEQHDGYPYEAGDTTSGTQNAVSENKKATEKQQIKPHTLQSSSKQKLWRPVSRGESKSASPVHTGTVESEGIALLEKVHDRILSGEASMQSHPMDDGSQNNQQQCSDDSGNMPFSSSIAKEFLERRWKEAIASDHVTLVLPPLSPGHEPPGYSDPHPNNSTPSNASDLHEQSGILDNAAETQPGRQSHGKFRKKPEKNMKTKYIPKQKAIP